jgi:hypothetical protein
MLAPTHSMGQVIRVSGDQEEGDQNIRVWDLF